MRSIYLTIYSPFLQREGRGLQGNGRTNVSRCVNQRRAKVRDFHHERVVDSGAAAVSVQVVYRNADRVVAIELEVRLACVGTALG